MTSAVNYLRPKIGKFAVHSWQKPPKTQRICSHNYSNRKEPNSSFRCKTEFSKDG